MKNKPMIKFVLICINFFCIVSYSQNLTISNSGETGTSGTNWSSTGENPINITVFGNAVINTSVIEKYLNDNKSIIITNNEGIVTLKGKIHILHNKKEVTFSINNLNGGDIKFKNRAEIISKNHLLNIVLETKGSIEIAEKVKLISNGGKIHFKAFDLITKKRNTPQNTIKINGIIDASSCTIGGAIFIESDVISIGAKAILNAKGYFGGGKILVGGDWQGGRTNTKDENMYQATNVTMEKGALMDASATKNGTGGKIVLWSNLKNTSSSTKVNGTLFAKGAGKSVSGGNIETSGGSVDFSNIKISTITSDGEAGNWLIDPYSFFFNTTQLTSLRDNLANTNIEVSTANSSAIGSPGTIFARGNISFEDNFTYTSNNARTLTLSVNENIWIKGNITSTSGQLSLIFNSNNGKSLYFNGDINTNGGSVTFNNTTNLHFQKTNGTQAINTNGGSLNFGSANIRLLRYDGTMEFNTAGGNLNMGTGTVEQINTAYQILAPQKLLNGWGGVHTYGEKTYGINIIAGREYTTRMYFWDSWDNESGQLFVRDVNNYNNVLYYFYANRAYNNGGYELNNLNANYSTQYQVEGVYNMGRSGYNDVYVNITFLAQHSGTLSTWTSLDQGVDDESIELYDVWETQYPTTAFNSGSRSLVLTTTDGQLNGGTKNYSGLATITFNTNNNDGYVEGIISGTTNIIKSGTGKVRFSGKNDYSGTTTVNAGTYRLVPYFTTSVNMPGNFINNGIVTYETGNNNNRPAIYLDGVITGNGTWNITSDILPSTIHNNRLAFRGSMTSGGPINISNYGNLWLEGININSTSPINLDGINSRLRLYGSTNAFLTTGVITGSGTVDFADGGGGQNLTLVINSGSNNMQFDGLISNSGTSTGPTTLNLKKEGSGNYTLTSNNTFSGTTNISSGTLILQNNAPNPTNKTFNGMGKLIIEPLIDSFTSSFSSNGWNYNSTLTGLTIGKPSNSANITFANATTINGPITAYGGTITLNANLTTTNNGSISLITDNALGGLTSARTLSAAGAFKYIPRETTFADNVTYPITNLTSSSTGLTIGKTTNTKDIIISADVTQAANVELYGNNLNINANVTTSAINAAMSLKGNTTIAAGKTITSGGNFTHDGNLLFKSDVNGTAAFGTLGGTFTKVSGVATVERYVPAKRGWRLLTAPLKGSTTNKIPANWQGVNGEGLLLFSPATYQSQTMTGYTTGGGMPNIWKYNSTSNAWSSIPNITTENLFTSTVNNGFLVFATGPSNSTNFATSDAAIVTTLKPKGDLISGDVTHSLTANKYHLIGNPYASPINPVTLRASNPNSKIWMIDPKLGTVGGYFAYDGSNWTPNVPTSSDAYIQSGQGFFVRNNTSDATFTISETHKAIGNSNTWFARTTNTQTTENVDKIRVLLNKKEGNNWILADGILAINHASGNNGLDATDTQKMSNFNENILFKNGTTSLSMEYSALPLVGHVQPMYITGTTVQPYQLQVFTEGYSNATVTPLLQDTQLGTFTPIPTDGSVITHSFTGVAATSTTPDQRFKIVYQSALNSADFNSLWAAVYPNPVNNNIVNIQLKSINDSTNYTLTNLLGQTVQKGKLNALQNTITLPELQEGIYMMTINQEGKRYTSKLQIQN